jgi:multidrug efflux pump subunit AcrA (membrane-fusion protein)
MHFFENCDDALPSIARFYRRTIMKTQFVTLLACSLCASLAAAQQSAGTLVLPGCRVHPVTVNGQAQVPAQEPGVLVTINVRDGMEVKAGQELAVIDDTQAQKAKRIAAAEHLAAKEKAESDIDVKHATAAAKVAEFDYHRSEEANKQTRGSVSEVEMEQKRFQWTRALFAIQQAKMEQVVSGFTAEAKLAEKEAAEDGIQRRRINAPINGVIEHVYGNIGEWVKPGDPVFRIIRMDHLRVEGILNHKDANPSDLLGKPVTVDVDLAGGKKAQFRGQIVSVSTEVDAAGQHVYAEVENRQENGQWVLRPGMGMRAMMTIQMR